MKRRTPALVLAVAGLVVSLVGLPTTAATADTPVTAAATTSERPGGSSARVLKRNKLYKAGVMPGVGCAPASQVPLDSSANLLAYYQSVQVCLDAAWKKELKGKKFRKAGIRFKAPKLKVHDGSVSTKCGNPGALSFYCPANRTIYMYDAEIVPYWSQYPSDYSRALTRLVGTHTLAHEYGHHVQELVGIWDAIGRRYDGKIERRGELQASCLGNVFLSAQKDAYPLAYDFAARTDLWRIIEVADHGSAANQAAWTAQGYATADPGSCNTWKAPGSQVS